MSSCLHGTFSILSFFLIFQSLIDSAYAWEGVVVRVVDGDTLIVAPKDAKQPELLGISVRLYGIDAPELAQPGGQESKAALEQLPEHRSNWQCCWKFASRISRTQIEENPFIRTGSWRFFASSASTLTGWRITSVKVV